MKLKTEIKLPTQPFEISHRDKIISFGSCFSENIGEKLSQHKFDTIVNPFGILFNPISVARAINECLENKQYSESDLNNNNEVYFSFNHHSKFSGMNKAEVVHKINSAIASANHFMAASNTLILTFGTAWVYRLKETNEVVANCYKLPNELFTKELLSIQEIVAEVSQVIDLLKSKNPEVKIITTISPVRHWKDGVVENQQSKASLHLALKEINETFHNSVYFHSYEILLDELRDYRFYAADMLHPSPVAIDYIWEKFGDTFFSKDTKVLNQRIGQINKEKNHRPFNPESNEFMSFKNQLAQKEKELYLEFPFLKK